MRVSASPARCRRVAAVALAGLVLGAASPALFPGVALADRADVAPPSAADREAAQRAFAQAQHAYRRGDFRHAAEQFEIAYAHAPHSDVLWNAARAWHHARELARAANLYAKFVRDAPPDARDRNSATTALAELSQKLARIDVVAPDFQDIRVDEQPLDGTSVYVTPGEHVIEGKIDGKPVRQTPTVAAGDTVSVALVAPPAPPPEPVAVVAPVASPGAEEGKSKRLASWPPAVVYVGAGATLVATGVMIWSAVDTENARQRYNATQASLNDGLDKEHRTNVLVAVSAGLGAFTLLSTLLFVDWHRHPAKAADGKAAARVDVGVGPGSLVMGGTF